MGSIQRGHGEPYLQVLAVELHPRDLGHIVLGEREDPMGGHLEVIRVVHVLRELQTTEHVELGEIDHDGHVSLALGRHIGGIDDPDAFDGRAESMGEIGCLDDAMSLLQHAPASWRAGGGVTTAPRGMMPGEGVKRKLILAGGEGGRRRKRYGGQRKCGMGVGGICLEGQDRRRQEPYQPYGR